MSEETMPPEATALAETAVESVPPPAVAPEVGPTVGPQLRAAREGKGLTPGEVAKALKLSTHQVEAMEAEDWASLPGKTISRGFVRNYARFLEMKPEPLMAALDGASFHAPQLEIPAGTSVSIHREGKASRRDYVRVFLGVFVLAAAVLAYWLLPREMLQSGVATLSRVFQGESAAPGEETPSGRKMEKSLAPPDGAADSSAALPAPQEVSAPAAAEAVPPPVADKPPAGMGVLQFSFSKPSWVEVRNGRDEVIYSRANEAGSEKRVEGKPPFVLVIGNASGVALRYNGQAVDLSRRSKDDVVRLKLE